MRPLRPLTTSCIIGTAPCAFCSAQTPSARPQSGPMCPQRIPLRPQCNIMSSPCPPPRGVKVINTTTAIHRPVDYSSPCRLLYSPVHSVHAIRCRQPSSRRPLPLPCRRFLSITPPQPGAQDEESHTPRHQGRSLR